MASVDSIQQPPCPNARSACGTSKPRPRNECQESSQRARLDDFVEALTASDRTGRMRRNVVAVDSLCGWEAGIRTPITWARRR